MAKDKDINLAAGILSFLSIAYFAFGSWVILDVNGALSAMSLSWIDSDGKFELLSSYGGINIATGVLCWWAVCKPALRPYAFIGPMVLNGGYVLGRVVSIVMLGVPGGFVLGAFTFEAFAFALALVGFRSLSGSSEK